MFDLIIRGGTVVDGSGAAAYQADVGIRGTRIAEIGKISEKADHEIDAHGLIVSPGFIDGHTHMDAQIFWDSPGSSSCWNGVTTVVMGNCGFTLAPVRPDARELVTRNLERAEDISAAAMDSGIRWGWETVRQYLDVIDALPKAINYAAQVGHSSLRTWAMGERAFEEQASDADLAKMVEQLRDALDAGAIGFSTSRSLSHETSDGRPVASRVAAWEEVRQLVLAMGKQGRGIFEISPEPQILSDDPKVREDYYGRLRNLAVESGVPVTFGIVPTGAAGATQLEFVDSTIAAGGTMFGQTHSRGVSVMFSFRSNLPFDRIPEWREVRSLPLDEQMVAFKDPDTRRHLIDAANRGPGQFVGGPGGQQAQFDSMWIYDDPIGENPLVGEVARQRGVDPVEFMIDLGLQTNFKQLFRQARSRCDDDELLSLMQHPNTVMTFSDSGAHVSQVIDSCIQTYLLSHWVRDLKAFSLENAVQMITSAAATAWEFPDRGLIKEGFVADLNVFDQDTVGPALPYVANDLPGGGTRLIQKSNGILATVVGGKVTLLEGESTGTMSGQLVRTGSR